jgi:hypothetical protein
MLGKAACEWGKRNRGKLSTGSSRGRWHGSSGRASVLAEMEERLWRGKSEGEAAKRRRRSGVTSSELPRCSQARRAPSTHAEVEARATRRGFDIVTPDL